MAGFNFGNYNPYTDAASAAHGPANTLFSIMSELPRQRAQAAEMLARTGLLTQQQQTEILQQQKLATLTPLEAAFEQAKTATQGAMTQHYGAQTGLLNAQTASEQDLLPLKRAFEEAKALTETAQGHHYMAQAESEAEKQKGLANTLRLSQSVETGVPQALTNPASLPGVLAAQLAGGVGRNPVQGVEGLARALSLFRSSSAGDPLGVAASSAPGAAVAPGYSVGVGTGMTAPGNPASMVGLQSAQVKALSELIKQKGKELATARTIGAVANPEKATLEAQTSFNENRALIDSLIQSFKQSQGMTNQAPSSATNSTPSRIIVNPKTGERLQEVNGKWVPIK